MAQRKGMREAAPRSPRFRTSCKRIAPLCCAPERSRMNRWHRRANKRFCQNWNGE